MRELYTTFPALREGFEPSMSDSESEVLPVTPSQYVGSAHPLLFLSYAEGNPPTTGTLNPVTYGLLQNQ